jgi:hypothetical protein
MKNLLRFSVTIACLAALTLPALAGDGGPAPVCPPGTDCSVRIPGGSPNDRPLCCSLQPPSVDRTFGDINVQDRTLAQFPLASPVSPLVTNCGRTNTKPQESSALTIPESIPLRAH